MVFVALLWTGQAAAYRPLTTAVTDHSTSSCVLFCCWLKKLAINTIIMMERGRVIFDSQKGSREWQTIATVAVAVCCVIWMCHLSPLYSSPPLSLWFRFWRRNKALPLVVYCFRKTNDQLPGNKINQSIGKAAARLFYHPDGGFGHSIVAVPPKNSWLKCLGNARCADWHSLASFLFYDFTSSQNLLVPHPENRVMFY